MPKHGSIILYVHGNQKARYDGQLRTATSTLTQLLNYVLRFGTLPFINHNLTPVSVQSCKCTTSVDIKNKQTNQKTNQEKKRKKRATKS